ncbi:S41 family peptidase [Neptunicella sp.]|uniref:S41 family peptidase n=1 Tax=Neptunicella sp. TaxID=2125986 RepID=UPI003F68BEE6
MGNHSEQNLDSFFELDGNIIDIGDHTYMTRINGRTPTGESASRYIRLRNANAPMFEKISENVLLFRIPSFDFSNKQKIDDLIEANMSSISSSSTLIIDIRNNGGGSDSTYNGLLPLLYTNPIRIVGVEYKSTPLNNRRMQDMVDGKYGRDVVDWAKKNLKTLQSKLGEFVMLEKSKISVTRFDQVLSNPKNIAILINENNASSAEQFLLEAKQSTKVKLFGKTTSGILDISNTYHVTSPSQRLTLFYSLSRSLRIPDITIDGIGIQPDYYLDNSIPRYGWIDFVVETLNPTTHISEN